MVSTKRAKWITALAATLLLLLLLAVAWLVRQPAPVSVSFDRYERSGLSNYAVLTITNNSTTPLNFTSFNTMPEGTVKHFYSLHSSNVPSAPQEFKPQAPGMLFAETLEPHRSKSVGVPVDEIERTVAIPFYLAVQNATPAQNRFLRIRIVIRSLLGLPNDVGNVFWCPVPLRVEPKSGNSQQR